MNIVKTNSLKEFIKDTFENYKEVSMIICNEQIKEVLSICIELDLNIGLIEIDSEYLDYYYVCLDDENFYIETLYKRKNGEDVIYMLPCCETYYICNNDTSMGDFFEIEQELKSQKCKVTPVYVNN